MLEKPGRGGKEKGVRRLSARPHCRFYRLRKTSRPRYCQNAVPPNRPHDAFEENCSPIGPPSGPGRAKIPKPSAIPRQRQRATEACYTRPGGTGSLPHAAHRAEETCDTRSAGPSRTGRLPTSFGAGVLGMACHDAAVADTEKRLNVRIYWDYIATAAGEQRLRVTQALRNCPGEALLGKGGYKRTRRRVTYGGGRGSGKKERDLDDELLGALNQSPTTNCLGR